MFDNPKPDEIVEGSGGRTCTVREFNAMNDAQRHAFSGSRTLTEDEHIRLVGAADYFWEEFSRLAGEVVRQFSPEIEQTVIAHLQEKTSIYGSRFRDHLQE